MSAPVTLNGLRTTLRVRGARGGRALLCLHPLGQGAAFHDGLAEALGAGWRVASHDQRGHGDATDQPAESLAQMVDDAEAALDHLSGRAHVAGFSMGGAVAAELAARRARDIPTLCLAATPHVGQPVFAERARAVREGSLAAVAEPTIERWFGRTAGEPAIEAARAALARLTPEGFDAAWRALASFQGYDRLAGRLPPALCLSFGDDLSTPPPVLDGIARTIRAAGGVAERADIPGAGHMGLLQKPREVAAALARFVAEREARA